jgi:hypothetical protein
MRIRAAIFVFAGMAGSLEGRHVVLAHAHLDTSPQEFHQDRKTVLLVHTNDGSYQTVERATGDTDLLTDFKRMVRKAYHAIELTFSERLDKAIAQ